MADSKQVWLAYFSTSLSRWNDSFAFRFIAGIAAACGIVGNAYITSTSQNFNSAKILNFTSTSIIGFICGIVVVAVCDFIPPAGHFNVHWHLFEKVRFFPHLYLNISNVFYSFLTSDGFLHWFTLFS